MAKDMRDWTDLDFMVHDAERQVEYTRKSLRDNAEWLLESMQQVIRYVDEGSSVNSLGAVQGKGLDVDRQCALLQAHEEHLAKLQRLQEKAS